MTAAHCGGGLAATVAVMIVLALTVALLFQKLYRSGHSYRAAGAADVGAETVAHHSRPVPPGVRTRP